MPMPKSTHPLKNKRQLQTNNVLLHKSLNLASLPHILNFNYLNAVDICVKN